MSAHLSHEHEHEYDEKKARGGDYSQHVGPAVEEGNYPPGADDEVKVGLKRQLKSRHIAMISIGACIGTGLFLGTGGALSNGGPLGLLMGYSLMGSICWAVMISLGEMISYLPIAGGHISLAARFVDPALSFSMGYNYTYNWIIVLPAELNAAAVLINLWNKSVNNAVWITMCLVVIVTINMFGAGVYGETEFWFASIKLLCITGLIILGIIISAGGGPDHQTIGFQYWRNPGALTQYHDIPGALGRFLGFFAVLAQAAFSFIGTEIVAIAAGEAKNPRKNIPRAIKTVYIRILLFYILGTFIIGILVPYNSPGLALNSGTALASPFVIAIQRAGIKVLPSIVNACLLTSAWSAASSDIFTSSRALYGLALKRQAPKIFARTTRSGLPIIAVMFCSLFGCLSYMSLSSTSGKVFGWFANLTSACGLLTWWGICFTYIRFHKGMKVQGMTRKGLPYASKLNNGAFAAWYGIVLISIILIFFGFSVFLAGSWDVATFVTSYLPLAVFPILWIGFKFIKKTRFVRASEMDFITGLDQIEEDSYEEEKPRNIFQRIWAMII